MQVLIENKKKLICNSFVYERWAEENYFKNLNSLPNMMKQDIIRYKDWKERQIRIEGKILLKKMLSYWKLDKEYKLENIKKSAENKSFFDNYLDFSIAHSYNMVVCAIAFNSKIGIDIEQIKPVDWQRFEDYFTENEFNFLENSQQPDSDFYLLWTKKEALSKAIGIGIELDFKSIDVKENRVIVDEKEYEFSEISTQKEYICSLAFELQQPI